VIGSLEVGERVVQAVAREVDRQEGIVKFIQNLKLRMQAAGLMVRSSRRRGSFLVLVVGTLAMLSIIMIVYVAVGSADKRTSMSITRRDRSEEIISLFADYAAQIVADDAVTMVPDASNGKPDGSTAYPVKGGNLFVREAWDAPTTNWLANSKTGTDKKAAVGNLADPSIFRAVGLGDDPWLASTTPTWLNFNASTTAPNPQTDKIFAKRRDWLHISNIAPDGRFINIYSLRDNFDAKPGTSNTASDRRMNADLSLLDANLDSTKNTAWNTAADVDMPAFFDSWQVNAFRPAKGPFDPNILKNIITAPTYPPYQWADADGDGFFDSRWFEMIDARGDASSASPTKFRSLLPSDPNFRWVFAARIVDLSALVNVNAAGDMTANPNDSTSAAATMPRKMDVIGLSPADIDLKRLLQLRDFNETILDQPVASAQPTVTIGDVQLNGAPISTPRTYFGGYGALRQPMNPSAASQDYTKYVDDISKAGTGPVTGFPSVTRAAPDLGLGSYRSLRGSLGAGGPTGRFSNFTAKPLDTQGKPFATIRDHATYYNTTAAPAGRAIYDSASKNFAFGTGFSIDNLVELLTFRGTNDSRVTTSLELALGGHFNTSLSTAPTATDPQNPLSPVRENRSTELEREGIALDTGAPTEAAMLKSYTDVRQYLTTHSGARSIVPAFNLSFTGANFEQPPDLLAKSDLASFIGENSLTKGLDGAAMFNGYAAALAPGLGIPETWKKLDLGSNANSLRGLFYGHQGPVTALLAAGHMTANIAAACFPTTADSRHLPLTLVLSEEAYQASRLPEDNVDSPWRQYFPGWWTGSEYRMNLARKSLEKTQVPPLPPKLSVSDTDEPVPALAANLYGMGDAHPFVVEVASFTLYRDAYPSAQNGLYDQVKADIEAPAVGNRPSNVTIRGNIDKRNDDFMFRVLAVKLHNPHAAAIRLSNVPLDTEKDTTDTTVKVNSFSDFFYLRVGETKANGARYYVLADANEKRGTGTGAPFTGKFQMQSLTIQPGETLVMYALTEDSRNVSIQRINRTTKDTSIAQDSPEALDKWLTKQLGPAGPSAPNALRRVRMVRADDNFESTTAQQSNVTFAFDQLVPNNDQDQTVSLFQAVRVNVGPLQTAGPGSDAGTGFNVTSNDRLCDRMRLGKDINLDRRLIETKNLFNSAYDSSISIDGMPVDYRGGDQFGDMPTAPRAGKIYDPNPPNQVIDWPTTYNARFTVTLATRAARKSNPTGAASGAGAMPAWAIDPKDEIAKDWYKPKLLPDQADSTPLKLALAMTDVGTGRTYAAYSSNQWRNDVLDTTVLAIYPELAIRPELRTDNQIGQNKNSEDFSKIARELVSHNTRYQGTTGLIDAPDGVSQLRVGDLLGVMAIGPCEVPVDKTGNPITDASKRWTTAAEALAIAFNYSDRANFDDWSQSGSKFGPLDYYMFDHGTATPRRLLFDGGYLKTDDFVAGRYDPSDDKKFFPTSTGAPIAGNVLNMLKIRSDSYSGLTMPVAGLVNINTAPQPVLRLLPLTFPSQNEFVDSASGQQQATFWPGADETSRKTEAVKTDIAAMIESYRDKISVPLRPDARGPLVTQYKTWFAPFYDRSVADYSVLNQERPNEPKIGDPTQTTLLGGRYWTNGIKGIREGAGFHSPAELLGVRAVTFDANGVTGGADGPSNIDFLGYRTTPSNLLGTENVVEQVVDVATDPSKPKITDVKALQFGHTYQDKIKILSGLLGSISVRSDMYAVWFIARGYQRSDVEGLPAEQPMVPSVERRFLMIIDRSNVTKIGQKPRVLAFVELPL